MIQYLVDGCIAVAAAQLLWDISHGRSRSGSWGYDVICHADPCMEVVETFKKRYGR